MKLTSNAHALLRRQIRTMQIIADASGGSSRWPMPVLQTTADASIFSEPALVKALFDRILELRKRKLSMKAMSALFHYPSPLARLTMVARSRDVWPLTASQKIGVYNDIAELLSYHYKQHPFCDTGKNILWSPSEIKRILKSLEHGYDSIASSLMAQLDGRLWMYSEMIFSRWHNLAHEFHGPYRVGNEWLLIKDWHDLKGPGWSPFRRFPHRSIRCYEFFRHNTIQLDIHNRLRCEKPLATTLTRSFVEIDGHPVASEEVTQLLSTIDRFLAPGAKWLATRTALQLKEMNAIMEFYAIKPLADILHIDWKPAKGVFANIRRNRLTPAEQTLLQRLRYLYQRNTIENIRIQYDPNRSII